MIILEYLNIHVCILMFIHVMCIYITTYIQRIHIYDKNKSSNIQKMRCFMMHDCMSTDCLGLTIQE